MMTLICGSFARSRPFKALGGSAAIPMDGPCVAGGSFTESKQWFYRNKAIAIAFWTQLTLCPLLANTYLSSLAAESTWGFVHFMMTNRQAWLL